MSDLGWLEGIVRGQLYEIYCSWLGYEHTIVGRYEGRRTMIARGRSLDYMIFDDPNEPGHKFHIDQTMIKSLRGR